MCAVFFDVMIIRKLHLDCVKCSFCTGGGCNERVGVCGG